MNLIFCFLLGFVLFTARVNAQWQQAAAPRDRVLCFYNHNAQLFAGGEDLGLFISSGTAIGFTPVSSGIWNFNYDVKAIVSSADTLWCATSGGGVVQSTDAGTTWADFNSGFATQSMSVGITKKDTLLFAAIDAAAGLQPSGVYRSLSRAAGWQRCAGYPAGMAPSSLAVTSAGVVVAGVGVSAAANVLISTDNGETWLRRGIPGEYTTLSLKTAGTVIYAGTSRGLYRSSNDGVSWNIVSPLLPEGTYDDFAVTPEGLYAACDPAGVLFISPDGNTVTNLTDNLNVFGDFVSALTISGQQLVVSLSAAQGIYYRALPPLSVVEPVKQPGTLEVRNYPNPFAGATQIKFTLPLNGEVAVTTPVKVMVYDILGRKVAEPLQGDYTAGTYSFLFTAKGLSNGVYICVINSGKRTGIARMILQR